MYFMISKPLDNVRRKNNKIRTLNFLVMRGIKVAKDNQNSNYFNRPHVSHITTKFISLIAENSIN